MASTRRRFEPLVVFPVAKLLLHLATIPGYGLFRDEYYYVACSREPAWGYVDHPPLSMFLLAVVRGLLGESIWALRLLPAVTGALTVLLVGLIARRLGGGRFAQSLSMVAVGLSFLFVFHYFSMNCLDVLVWTATAYLLIRIADGGSPRLWVALGTVLGLGLLNKVSVLWLGAGLAVGLVLTSERRWLRTRWPWLAGGIALMLFLPHLLWQVRFDWPTLEFIRNATGDKMVEVAPLDFVRGQLERMSPVTVPIWLAGLGFLALSPTMRRYRILAWIYCTVFLILMLSGSSRPGYLGATYAWLLAAGAVAWESWLAVARARHPGLRWALLTVVTLGCLATVPFALPVLPVDTYIAYADALDVEPSTAERKELSELPQHYADMFGWRELVDEVARAYDRLSPAEREVATIFTPNYGNSGALDYHGARLGLPPSISGHNNYWLWGTRGFTGEVLVVVGADRETVEAVYTSVERAGTVRCRYCMPYENDKPVWMARGPKRPLAEIWPELKHYD